VASKHLKNAPKCRDARKASLGELERARARLGEFFGGERGPIWAEKWVEEGDARKVLQIGQVERARARKGAKIGAKF